MAQSPSPVWMPPTTILSPSAPATQLFPTSGPLHLLLFCLKYSGPTRLRLTIKSLLKSYLLRCQASLTTVLR